MTAADVVCCKQLNIIKSSRKNYNSSKSSSNTQPNPNLTEEYAAKIVDIRTKKYISTDPHT